MAQVDHQPTSMRSKLGFGRKKDAQPSQPRKLVKKTRPDDAGLLQETYYNEAIAARRQDSKASTTPAQSRQQSISSTQQHAYGPQRTPSTVTQDTSRASTKPFRNVPAATKFVNQALELDKDTGERKDLTDMMHAFTFDDTEDIVRSAKVVDSPLYDPSKQDGRKMLARTSPEVWLMIGEYLTAQEMGNLLLSCRTLYQKMGKQAYTVLSDPTNRSHRIKFLLSLDEKLPQYLFCFPCAQWHFRTHPGQEVLRPHGVRNPLFNCPNIANNLRPPPRLRIAEGRTLPFSFTQLAKRCWAYGSHYGIPHQSLARRWKEPSSPWIHETAYHIHKNGHVLLRVKSQAFVRAGMTPAAKRLLLFSRGDYTPYFSVCSHWQRGLLTDIPKCALDHIPVPKVNALTQFKTQRATGLVPLCSICRPMRRCPACPTEYLVELKLIEDTGDKTGGASRFKQALFVTRWSDLGQGYSPDDPEWAAIAGRGDSFDSFAEVGNRAVSGIFESAFTDTIPGQRILSMNPNNVKDGENEDWY